MVTRRNVKSQFYYRPRKMKQSRFRNSVSILDDELKLLELIYNDGPCSSDQVHKMVGPHAQYLITMRRLHGLVEKGFLQRITINKKLLYRTARNYGKIRDILIRARP